MYTYPIYIKRACMIRMITLILPLCCLFNPERHELARGIYIIREVYIAMFVIRIIQLTIAFNHSYHICKFDIDWISILLKISKVNANFDIIAACSSSPSLLLRSALFKKEAEIGGREEDSLKFPCRCILKDFKNAPPA